MAAPGVIPGDCSDGILEGVSAGDVGEHGLLRAVSGGELRLPGRPLRVGRRMGRQDRITILRMPGEMTGHLRQSVVDRHRQIFRQHRLQQREPVPDGAHRHRPLRQGPLVLLHDRDAGEGCGHLTRVHSRPSRGVDLGDLEHGLFVQRQGVRGDVGGVDRIADGL